MSISDRENQIFAKWKERIPKMVRDGVVDESTYRESDPKILFILKDSNDANPDPS